jgi:hypothetical protein
MNIFSFSLGKTEKTVLICSDSLDLPSYHYHSTEGFCPRIGLFLETRRVDGNRPMASCRFSLAEGGVTFIFQMMCIKLSSNDFPNS